MGVGERSSTCLDLPNYTTMLLYRCVLVLATIVAGAYSDLEEANGLAYDANPEESYYDAVGQQRSMLEPRTIDKRGREWYMMKRWPVCTRYSKSCNISPHSCCPGTACRCNIWGQNCRCQRAGLLAQWLG